MDMYVRLFEDRVRGADDNPTVGLILCTDKRPYGGEILGAERKSPTLRFQVQFVSAERRGIENRDRTRARNGGEGAARDVRGDGKMKYPDDWQVVRFDDCAEVLIGQSPKGDTYNTKRGSSRSSTGAANEMGVPELIESPQERIGERWNKSRTTSATSSGCANGS